MKINSIPWYKVKRAESVGMALCTTRRIKRLARSISGFGGLALNTLPQDSEGRYSICSHIG